MGSKIWMVAGGGMAELNGARHYNGSVPAARGWREARAERQSAALDESTDAAFSESSDGFITAWNSGAERLFGYAADEACAHHASILVPHDSQHAIELAKNRLLAGEERTSLRTVLRHRDQSRVSVLITCAAIRDHDEVLIGISTTARPDGEG